jgi:hypothetical protein
MPFALAFPPLKVRGQISGTQQEPAFHHDARDKFNRTRSEAAYVKDSETP